VERRRIVRKVLLLSVVALAMAGRAQAQQASLYTGTQSHASLFQGSFQPVQIQYVTIVDKSPLVAPIPNQGPQPGFFDNVLSGLLGLFRMPTIGANPVLSVQSRSTSGTATSGATVPPSTFQPPLPIFNNQ
jgi:hypothetical protein